MRQILRNAVKCCILNLNRVKQRMAVMSNDLHFTTKHNRRCISLYKAHHKSQVEPLNSNYIKRERYFENGEAGMEMEISREIGEKTLSTWLELFWRCQYSRIKSPTEPPFQNQSPTLYGIIVPRSPGFVRRMSVRNATPKAAACQDRKQ